MILALLAGISLVVTVAVDPAIEAQRPDAGPPRSLAHRNVAVQPLVRSATECVVRNVAADPRFPDATKGGDLNELIVASMESCAEAMRDMIDAYDRNFGAGTGQSFFLGPYLDILPSAVHTRMRSSAPARD